MPETPLRGSYAFADDVAAAALLHRCGVHQAAKSLVRSPLPPPPTTWHQIADWAAGLAALALPALAPAVECELRHHEVALVRGAALSGLQRRSLVCARLLRWAYLHSDNESFVSLVATLDALADLDADAKFHLAVAKLFMSGSVT